MKANHQRTHVPTASPLLLPFLAVLAGATAMGISPIFVRLAEVGPLTSAFWRVALALPIIALWARAERNQQEAGQDNAPPWSPATFIAGAVFAGDLICWHLAIMHTTIANATFFATMAPVWVLLMSGLVLKEHVTLRMWASLALCLAGAAALTGSSFSANPERLFGDAFGILTSIFFGCYFLAMRAARTSGIGSGLLMFRSSLVTAALLFIAAWLMEGSFLPDTVKGLSALIAIALLSHAGGQGLLAYALGHLSAAYSSLVIFLEAVVAAGVAWVILSEALTLLQIAGGAIILFAVLQARPNR